jgi:adenosylmethionine-8-amino-7-oxononanoate aminotransferase
VAEPFYNSTVGMWRHGYTYSGHAAAATAALTNLDILVREGLIERVAKLEGTFADKLHPLATHPLVSEVRTGEGLLAAVQIDPAAITQDPELPDTVIRGMREAGVLSRPLATGAVHVSPPFVITNEQLDELAIGIQVGLDSAT